MNTMLALALLTLTLIVLCVGGISSESNVQAQDVNSIRTKTGSYQLDTGDFVHWWIDEDRALLCEAFGLDGRDRAGYALTCLPLSATVYAWPAPPVEK